MFIPIDKATIEYAKRAGQAVLQYQEYQAKQFDANQERINNYAPEALGGFVEKPYNAVVNNINGLSEPTRAFEKNIFGTNYIPELPRSTIGDRSEYWQQKRYGDVSLNAIGEGATTLQVGIMTGKPMFNSRIGALLGVQVGGYNLGVGASGTDPLNPNREMSSLERGTRIVGETMGVASAPFSPGGRAFANDALVLPSRARNAVNNLDDIFKPPTAPLTEGINFEGQFNRVRIQQQKTKIEFNCSQAAVEVSARYLQKTSSRRPAGGDATSEGAMYKGQNALLALRFRRPHFHRLKRRRYVFRG
jgi:hypothetical protein